MWCDRSIDQEEHGNVSSPDWRPALPRRARELVPATRGEGASIRGAANGTNLQLHWPWRVVRACRSMLVREKCIARPANLLYYSCQKGKFTSLVVGSKEKVISFFNVRGKSTSLVVGFKGEGN